MGNNAAQSQPADYLTEVRNQYEELPYPPRNPEDEWKRLLFCPFDHPYLINHYCYAGMRDVTQNQRILVAGCGTGDAVIYMAEQYAETNNQIVALDMSEHSLNVCKERAAIRKLDNIEFVHASIYDLPTLGLGSFDHVNSTGVLHHLDDPDKGLKLLADTLCDDGSMTLMVYAQIGRSGVYNMQETMRRICADNVTDIDKKVTLCTSLLQTLPSSNWLRMNTEGFQEDLQKFGPSGIYDLFLHQQDRAYTIPQLYEWVESTSLHVNALVNENTSGHYLYDPLRVIRDKALRETIEELPERERYAIGELLYSNIVKHSFLASKHPTKPAVFHEKTVPVFFHHAMVANTRTQILQELTKATEGATLTIPFSNGFQLNIAKHRYSAQLFAAIDESRTVSAIIEHVMTQENLPDMPDIRSTLSQQLKTLYDNFHEHDFMLLKLADVPASPGPLILQQYAQERLEA